MITEPTHDQCTANERVQLPDGRTAVAAWYPQMGGYTSHCLLIPESSGCFDVLVWHNGDFPLAENYLGVPENPRELHHCDPDQFIRFGELANRVIDSGA